VDYESISSTVHRDLGVQIPPACELKSWRSDRITGALHTPVDVEPVALMATEFFSKCENLPGILPVSSIPQFLATQERLSRSFSAPDRVLDDVTAAMRWLLGDYVEAEAATSVRHGPGATIDGLLSYDKWLLQLPSHLPITDHIDPLGRFPRSLGLQRYSRFAEVPKTAWTTRGICIEECGAQLLQQGIGQLMRRRFRRVGIDLSNQWKTNVRLTSVPGFHTVDLSAASDSISVELVRSVFTGPELERWYEAMASCRSVFTEVKEARGESSLVLLRSFASMGNGFCFTLLTAFCAAACYAAARRVDNMIPLTRGAFIRTLHEHFAVYGDDIVCRDQFRDSLYVVLAQLGFVINTSKSSGDGPLRESCGAFALHNSSRTVVLTSLPRIRSLRLDSPSDITRACALQRTLWRRGWIHTARLIAERVNESVFREAIRNVRPATALNVLTNGFHDPFGDSLVVVSTDAKSAAVGQDRGRQRSFFATYSFRPRSRRCSLADTVGIAACLLGGGMLPPEETYGDACLLQRTRVYI
jgi:hypothetical protein